MNITTSVRDGSNVTASATQRFQSIDILRGLTMAVMIFVNALSGAEGLPWWTFHALAQQDVMTYVDMVFPFFLFVVGMSMPLSINQRLKRNASLPLLWLHVLHRSVCLIVLGFILANAEQVDTTRTGMSSNLWALIALLSASLYLNVWVPSTRYPAYANVLRLIGLAGVIVQFAIFRRVTPHGRVAWIDFSYPEILGLIGFSFFAVSILYIPTRRWVWAPVVWFIVLTGLCVASTAHLLAFPDHLSLFVWPFGNGSMGCVIMAGIVTSNLFLALRDRWSNRRKTIAALTFAALNLLAGWLLKPLGISKIRATPTWSLWSIAASVILFTLLYWICDVQRKTGWAWLLKPAGSNTLTTYLLPDFWYFLSALVGFTWLDLRWNFGASAVLKNLAFTVVILLLSAGLTKLRLRLQL